MAIRQPRFSVPATPRTSARTVVGIILAVLLIAVFAAVILGFSLMIVVGILFAEFGWLAPIGFGPSFGLAFFGSILLASTRAKVNASA